MSRTGRCVAAGAASVLAHGVLATVLLVAVAHRNEPEDTPAETRLSIETLPVTESVARAEAPESEAAAEAEAQDDSVGQAAIPVSRAAATALPQGMLQPGQAEVTALVPGDARAAVTAGVRPAGGAVAAAPPAGERLASAAAPAAMAAGVAPAASQAAVRAPRAEALAAADAQAATLRPAGPPAESAMAGAAVGAAVPAATADGARLAAEAASGADLAALAPPEAEAGAAATPEPVAAAALAMNVVVAAALPQRPTAVAALAGRPVAAAPAAPQGRPAGALAPAAATTAELAPEADIAAPLAARPDVAPPAVAEARTAGTLAPPVATTAVLAPDAVPAGVAIARAPAASTFAPRSDTAPPAPARHAAAAETPGRARLAPGLVPPEQRVAGTLAWTGGAQAEMGAVSLAAIQSFVPEGDVGAAGGDAVRDALERLLTSVPCARLQTVFLPETGQLELRGHVPEAALGPPVLAALRDRVGDAIPVVGNVLVLPAPQCTMLAALDATGLPQSTDQLTNPRIVGTDAHARVYDFTDGQRMVFDLTGPDYGAYVYADYYDADGMVIHLQPNEFVPLPRVGPAERLEIGSDAAGGLELRVAPPFGQEIVVALATSAPLYDGVRPLREPAGPYLDFLRARVGASRAGDPGFRGEWVYFFVRTEAG